MLKNVNRFLFITLHKIQVQMGQKSQYKPESLNLTEEKVGNSLECVGIGHNFLNRTLTAQALRSTINKWDIMN